MSNKAYTKAEETAFFKVIKATSGIEAERDYHLNKLLRYTGLRIQVLTGRIEEADYTTKKGRVLYPKGYVHPPITVKEAREAIRTGELIIRTGIMKNRNGDKNFKISVGKKLSKALKGLLRIRETMGHEFSDESHLIIGRQGSLSQRQIELRHKKWAKLAGVGGTPHTWRHTYAVNALATSSIKDPTKKLILVSKSLCHKDIKTTVKMYLNPGDRELSDLQIAMAS